MAGDDGGNLLDVVPRRVVAYERADDGTVVLLEPKFPTGLLGRFLQPRLSRPFFRIDLDEIGSQVWDALDGRRTVRQVAELLDEQHGADFDPDRSRLVLYLRTMHGRGHITFDETG